MKEKPLITIVIGTRPEGIKLAPIIKIFQNCNLVDTRVVLTGQHNEMLNQVMKIFKFKADKNLKLMQERQSISHITSEVIKGLTKEYKEFPPSIVIVQGDTTTAFSGALAAFYEQITIAHVEAGLRTDSLYSPFPEEVNRRFISQISSLNFAPTTFAENNLKKEGVLGEVFVTGNTVIDALNMVKESTPTLNLGDLDLNDTKLVLLTVHRRENWGRNINNICKAIKILNSKYKKLNFLIPMHKNSIVRNDLKHHLNNMPGVFLTEPFDYLNLISAIKHSYLILTDSGGIQEEAPTFGKPVFVLRKKTERPEGIKAGISFLIGTETDKIVEEVSKIIEDKKLYESIANATNPFGDGRASERILKIILEKLFSKSSLRVSDQVK